MSAKNSSIPVILILILFAIATGAVSEQQELFNPFPADVLLTIVTAFASILGIMFSVLFIVTQLNTSRYSSQFSTLLFESNLVLRGFVISAAFILWLIVFSLVHSFFPRYLSIFLLVITIATTGGLIFTLYWFIMEVLNQARPTNLLNQYLHEMTYSKYIDSIYEAKASDNRTEHPVQPVFDLTRNALEMGEDGVAISGTQAIGDLTEDVLMQGFDENKLGQVQLPDQYESEHLPKDGYDDRIEILIRDVLERYIPTVVRSGAETDRREIIQIALNHTQNLAELGRDNDDNTISALAILYIIRELLGKLPDSIGGESSYEPVLRESILTINNITLQSIKSGYLSVFLDSARAQYEAIRWIIDSLSEDEIFDYEPLLKMLDIQGKILIEITRKHSSLLHELNPSVDELMGTKDNRVKPFEEPNYAENTLYSALIQSRILIMAITSRHVSKVHTRDKDLQPSSLRIPWTDLLEFTSEQGPSSQYVILAQRYIEMMIYMEKESSGIFSMILPFSQTSRGNIEQIESAFDAIIHEPDLEGKIGYSGFRGQARAIIWSPFTFYNYSEEEIRIARKIRTEIEEQYEKELLSEYQRQPESIEERYDTVE